MAGLLPVLFVADVMVVAGAGGVAAAGPVSCVDEAVSEAQAVAVALACGRPVVVSSSRTELSQVFAEPDGRLRLEAAAVPQRTRRPDGSWADIDLNLSRGPDGLWRPAVSVADVRFSDGGAGPLVTLVRGGKVFTLSWPGSLPAPVVAGEQATYVEALPGVDVVVRATRVGFTHLLVVKTARAAADPAVRRIRFAVGGDVTVTGLPDGGLRAVAGDVLVGRSAPAAMWDSSRSPGLEPGDGLASSAAGPGLAARRAPVTATVSGGDVVLEPDAGMLASGAVTFPLYVDPPWSTGYSRWAYANSINRDWAVNGEAWVGVNPYDGTRYRSYFEFPMSALGGKYIYSAYVQMKLDHSWSCGNTWTHMYWTGMISPNSSPRTTWAPSHLGHLDGEPSHANEAGGCGEIQPDMTVNFGTDNANVKWLIQQGANGRWTGVTIGFCACEPDGSLETSQDRWKRWFPASAKLIVDYDSVPGAPNGLRIAGVSCPSGGIAIGTLSPTFSAVYPDADTGQTLTGSYEWIEVPSGGMSTVTDTSPTRKSAPPAAPASANTRATTTAVSGLVLGKKYAFRVRTTDPAPYNQTSPWSAWCQFWPETTVPPAPGITPGTFSGPGKPVTFTFSTTTTDVVKFRYGWTSPPTTEITATGTTTKTATVTLTVPKYGQNTIWVRGIDAVGNLGNIGAKEITVGRPSPPVARWGLETYPGQTQTQALADAQPALGDTDGTGPLTANTPLTPNNITWTSDVRLIGGQTTTFNGTTSYLTTTGPVINTTKSFSVAAWVKLADKSVDRTAVSQTGVNYSAFYLQYQTGPDRWRFHKASSDSDPVTWQGPTSTSVPKLNTWTHLAGVYDATAKQLRLYVNGVLEGTVNGVTLWYATGPLRVGRSGGRWWAGEIADVQVFDRVLVDHDFTGQLKSDPDSGGFDEPGILAPIEVGRWDMEAGVSCYLQDLENTCEAPDGTGFDRWLALSRGSEIAAGYGGGLGLRLDGYYFPDENPEPWETTQEYARTAFKTGVDTTGPDPLTLWQNKPVLRTDQSFTVSTWARMERTDRYQVLLAQDDVVNSGFYLYYGPETGGKWKFKMRASSTVTDDTNSTYAIGPALSATDSWHHVVGVLDVGRRQLRLYVDGDLVAASTLNAAWQPWQATGSLTAGRSIINGRPVDWLYGSVDQAQVYQGAMTDAQVKVLHDAQVVS